ncbi:putative tobH [Mycobacterium xenopi 4042]|uniref:Putative tobH n=1 Tax=Mycobacterium xenopi 4042 TaxID=1299334 RepID=X7YIC2_MYCXE|nr:putative tobH [Mycobacterium xenopi 4042]
MLEPRLPVPDDFVLCRYLAAGLAVLAGVDPGLRIDLARLADELDTEALRNSAGRELFTNPAKTLAERMSGRRVVLAGDCAATLALARHGCSVLLRIAHQVVAASGLADAVVALRAGFGDAADSLFHDEQIDGHCPNGRAWWR